MKVNDSNSNGVSGLGQTSSAGQATLGHVSPAKAGASSSDRVDVSSLSSLVRALNAPRPEHTARLESLTQLVASANYYVDPDVLSASIIQNSVR